MSKRFTVQGPSQVARPPAEHSGSGGTSPVTRDASPSANRNRPDRVPMPLPATIGTAIATILSLMVRPTRRAFLGRIRRINPLDTDSQTLGLVRDELRHLIKD